MSGAADGCGAPAGGYSMTAGTTQEAVIEGHVRRGGEPAVAGYARLLNAGGDFAAEVPLGDDGGFRFFAAPGTWTVRVLVPGGLTADETVSADRGHITRLEVAV